MPITFDSGRSPENLGSTWINHFYLGQECTQASHFLGQSLPNSFYSLHALHASKGCGAGSHQVKPWFLSLSGAPLLSLQCKTGSSAWSPVGWGDPSQVDSGVTAPGSPCQYQTSLDSRSVSTTQCLWSQPSHIQATKSTCNNLSHLGIGSIPINTIFRGMNIHKYQLFWCELQGYKVLTHCHFGTVNSLFRNENRTGSCRKGPSLMTYKVGRAPNSYGDSQHQFLWLVTLLTTL